MTTLEFIIHFEFFTRYLVRCHHNIGRFTDRFPQITPFLLITNVANNAQRWSEPTEQSKIQKISKMFIFCY